MLAKRVREVLLDRQRVKERAVLKDVGDFFADIDEFVLRKLGDILALA